MADAGRAGASADAFEIEPPAIWSARPSRDAARMRPLLHSPARLRLSRCQIKLGEHTPADLSREAAACWDRARRGTEMWSPVGSLRALVVFMSLIVACRAAFVNPLLEIFSPRLTDRRSSHSTRRFSAQLSYEVFVCEAFALHVLDDIFHLLYRGKGADVEPCCELVQIAG